jgi:hypothetical protein
VVCVFLVTQRWIEGDFVISGCIRDALLEELGHVVTRAERNAAALRGDHFQAQVAREGLVAFANPFDEILPVEGAEAGGVGGAQRIDAVKGDAALEQDGGQTDDMRKQVFLLFCTEVDVGPGKKRPPRRHPENDFAAGTRGLADGKFLQRVEGKLEALVGAIEASATIDEAEADRVLLESGAQRVAVGREAFLTFGASIRKDSEGCGIGKMTSVDTKEFIDLLALVGDGLLTGVDSIHHKNHFDRSLPSVDGLEGKDGLHGFVIQKSEILLLKAADGRPGFRRDDDIECDGASGLQEQTLLLSLLRLLS